MNKLSKVNEYIRRKAKELKKQSVVVYLALMDKRTSLVAKIFALLSIAYLLSPIDLIPDFIPVLGLLDDLLLVPLLIYITLKLIPPPVLEDIRKNAQALQIRKKWYFALPVVLLYLLLFYYSWKYIATIITTFQN